MFKLQMNSPDQVKMNIDRIAELFPQVVTEARDSQGRLKRAVDFDLLKQELTDFLVESEKERYQLTWPGKKAAVLLANTPTAKTLRPVKEESVNWENTRNLYIEGDNLEALKLLQESYLSKIKCIYIDPPYNTGKDFIYRDDYKKDKNDYLRETGQIDQAGNRLLQNNETNGRFHSDWLSMIYPRLKLVRNLMSEDGSIFISIDDNEADNLKKVCDEIFGTDNFVAQIVVYSNPRGRQSSNNIAQTHEYLLIYAKDIWKCSFKGIGLTPAQAKEYNREDGKGRYREIGLRLRGGRAAAAQSPSLHFPIYFDPEEKEIYLENSREGLVEIIPKFADGTLGTWRWSKGKIIKDRESLLVRPLKLKDGSIKYDVFQKDYLTGEKTRKVKSLWDEKEINYDRGAEEIRRLFGHKLFDYAKPLFMLKKIVSMAADSDSIILDFFAGSASTAHAALQLNAETGGRRSFIMVQLPESIDAKSNASQMGYKNICQLSRERIKLAGEKITQTNPEVDCGFRLFKLDSTNMKDNYYRPDNLCQADLFEMESPIKEGRTGEDLLIQVMLEYGLELSLPIERLDIEDCTVFTAGGTALWACFDGQISENTLRAMAAAKPSRVVLRDSIFANDWLRLTVEETFAQISPGTDIKVI